jgi:hypothetical protein
VRVLYVAGYGRSGSTILGNVLGEVDDLFSGGELRHIWKRGIVENRLCGSGEPFLQSTFWRRVLEESFGGVPLEEAHWMVSFLGRRTTLSGVPRGIAVAPGKGPDTRRALGLLDSLYRGIRAVSGAAAIVDTSKTPLYALLLSAVPGVDLHVVHLVRDVRAVTFSWRRKKLIMDRGDQSLIPRHSVVKSSLQWVLLNGLTHRLPARFDGRWMRIRYEDFVASPREGVEAILRALGVPPGQNPVRPDGTVILGENLSVSGNPNRFTRGPVSLKLDDAWKREMGGWDRSIATAVGLPLLLRYGYFASRKARG